MIYITGDLHADFKDERIKLISSLTEKDYLIVCGDFGFDWNRNTIEKYHNIKNKGTVLFVDGNHENFDILNSLPTENMFGADVGVFGNNTYHLRRGRIYEIEGKSFFCFGGASSIDMPWRLEAMKNGAEKCWWGEECSTNEDYERAVESLKEHDYKFDYFISHACNPDLVKWVLMSPKSKFLDMTELAIRDLELLIKENGGSYLGHFFGHYHVNCGMGREHCLYENVVNLTEGTITTGKGNKYEFNIEGNGTRADFGPAIEKLP